MLCSSFVLGFTTGCWWCVNLSLPGSNGEGCRRVVCSCQISRLCIKERSKGSYGNGTIKRISSELWVSFLVKVCFFYLDAPKNFVVIILGHRCVQTSFQITDTVGTAHSTAGSAIKQETACKCLFEGHYSVAIAFERTMSPLTLLQPTPTRYLLRFYQRLYLWLYDTLSSCHTGISNFNSYIRSNGGHSEMHV